MGGIGLNLLSAVVIAYTEGGGGGMAVGTRHISVLFGSAFWVNFMYKRTTGPRKTCVPTTCAYVRTACSLLAEALIRTATDVRFTATGCSLVAPLIQERHRASRVRPRVCPQTARKPLIRGDSSCCCCCCCGTDCEQGRRFFSDGNAQHGKYEYEPRCARTGVALASFRVGRSAAEPTKKVSSFPFPVRPCPSAAFVIRGGVVICRPLFHYTDVLTTLIDQEASNKRTIGGWRSAGRLDPKAEAPTPSSFHPSFHSIPEKERPKKNKKKTIHIKKKLNEPSYGRQETKTARPSYKTNTRRDTPDPTARTAAATRSTPLPERKLQLSLPLIQARTQPATLNPKIRRQSIANRGRPSTITQNIRR